MAASTKTWWKKIKSKYNPKALLKYVFDPQYPLLSMLSLLLAEVIVNWLVIGRIKYTEIDWVAYMQEVEGVVNGTYDYTQLKGDTGPLVYPAGFVYIYLALYYVTGHGVNIQLGQYIFAGLYIISLVVIFDIYRTVKRVPPYMLFFMCCASYRIHSIYILRLFNDPVAMLFLYIAIDMFLHDRWLLGCFVYSCGVSIKMNILLFSPGLLMLLMARHGTLDTIKHLIVCAVTQVVLGLPFLLENPVGYISRSFNLGRRFFYKWTVNWRLLPEEIFLNQSFQVALLVSQAVVLLLFFYFKWRRLYPRISFQIWMRPSKCNLTSDQILIPLFSANFIGMCFSRSLHYQFYVWYFHSLHYLLWCTYLPVVIRSLHYQFYVWYFHSLHYLLWCTYLPVVIRILLLGVIELCWNTYPSTVLSSSTLHVCHAVMILGLWYSPDYTPHKKTIAAEKMS